MSAPKPKAGVFQRHTRTCTRPARGCACPWSFSFEVNRGGKRKQVTRAGFGSQRAAVAARDEAREAAKIGPVVDRRQTVAAALDGWLKRKVADGRLRPSTARSYESHVRLYLRPILGGVKVADLTVEHLEHLLDEVRRERPDMSAQTLSRVYATLRSFVRAQYRRGRIAHDPTARMEGVSVTNNRVAVWQPSEFGRFMDWAERRGEPLAPAFHLLATSGLRRGEACGLSWLDVDLDRKRLVVRQQVIELGATLLDGKPKTRAGEDRIVDLDPLTVDVLKQMARAQDADRARLGDVYRDHGAVLALPDGTPMRPERLTRGLPRLVATYNAEQKVARLGDTELETLAEQIRAERKRERARRKASPLSAVVRRARADAEFLAALRADPTLSGTPLPVIAPHALRHLQASLMLAAGVPLAVVSKRLGHSSIQVTADLYSHLTEGVGAQAAAAAAALIPRASAARS